MVELLENKLNSIISTTPQSCGVYLMKSDHNKILYIGKAKNLNKRLKSYLKENNSASYKALFLIPNVDSIEFIVCKNEKEALILENNLIKKHQPKYNVLLKDDKTYPGIAIDQNHEFPRIFYTRKQNPKYLYFGPYSLSSKLKNTMRLIRSIFGLRNCKDSFFNNRIRPCISYETKLCSAPCANKIGKEEYSKMLLEAIKFIEGDYQSVIRKLQTEMKVLSAKMQYEEAGRMRDKIDAISLTMQEQRVELKNKQNIDAWGIQNEDNRKSISRLIYRNGKLIDCINRILEESPLHESIVLDSFITQIYLSPNIDLPSEILLPFRIANSKILKNVLFEQAKTRVSIRISRSENEILLTNKANDNAIEYLKTSNLKILGEIKDRLNLTNIPHIIECFDISNIGTGFAVGARVAMKNGVFEKSLYRRYKIKSQENKQDDYGMMNEILTRRIKENDNPDLIIIDGGIGHLNSALYTLREAKKKIQVVSISKGENRKTNLLHIENRKTPINLNDGKKSSNLLISIRDEAHRFAIAYHRKKREQNIRTSFLDNIKGIGEKTKIAILKKFGGIEQLEHINKEELTSIKGINEKLANEIISKTRELK